MSHKLHALGPWPYAPLQAGVSLVEVVVAIVIVGVLAAIAVPQFINGGTEARIAVLQGLTASVRSSEMLVQGLISVRGAGSSGQQAGITWITLADGSNIRVWNGYPDRWCDGIGILQQGLAVPSGGCYQSSAPVTSDAYTFYGYGNSQIPNGNAGWRIESAPNPLLCSLAYQYNGAGEPIVTLSTSGC